MKRDALGWLAMAASIAVTAQGEWALAAACGYHPIVAGALPVAIDAYAIRALRSGREVLAAVLAMVATNSAAHLLHGGMLQVSPWLVVAVSAIAPLVLWRVHALAPEAPDQSFSRSQENAQGADQAFSVVAEEGAPEYLGVGSAGPTPSEVPEGPLSAEIERVTQTPSEGQAVPLSVGSSRDLTNPDRAVEEDVQTVHTLRVDGVSSAYPTAEAVYPAPVLAGYRAEPERVRLDFLPLPARPRATAAEPPRTRLQVDAEYVPDVAMDDEYTSSDLHEQSPVEDELTLPARERFAAVLAEGSVPSVRTLRAEYGIGSARAQRVQAQLQPAPAAV